MRVIGVDPGWNGGLAIFDDDILKAVYRFPTDRDEDKLARYLELIIDINPVTGECETVVYIEKVWAFPGNAVRAAFSFGKNYGVWIGTIKTLEIPLIYVRPTEWQKEIGIRVPKDRKKRKKYFQRRAKSVAKGSLKKKISLVVADAVCIGMYGVRKESLRK